MVARSGSTVPLWQMAGTGHSHYNQQPLQSLCGIQPNKALSPSGHAELLEITDQIEIVDAGRAQDLIQLAQLRNGSVDEPLVQLGIRSSVNA